MEQLNKRKETTLNILALLFFISFLVSMNIWFSWGNKSNLQLYTGLATIAILLLNHRLLDFSIKNIVLFILMLLAHHFYTHSLRSFYYMFGISFSIALINNTTKKIMIEKITKLFAFIMIPAILIFILRFYTKLTPFDIITNETDNAGYMPYENFIFCIWSSYYDIRFSGPFLEPGHLGMMIAFLLFANNYDFSKWENIIIGIALLFTFSLAGYVLFAIGFIFCLYNKGKLQLKALIIIGILAEAIYFGATVYNRGNNLLNDLIISRLAYDEKEGKIAGDNRNTELLDDYYDFFTKDNSTLWTGVSSDEVQDMMDEGAKGAGYKMFIISRGLLGLLFTALVYIWGILCARNRKYAILFFLFIAAAFWQRSYPTWTSWYMCFIWGVTRADSFNLPIKDEKPTKLFNRYLASI